MPRATEERFFCDLCSKNSKGFARRYDLTRHRRTHLPKDQRPFQCEYRYAGCSFSSSQQSGLNNHMNSIHRGWKIECKYPNCLKKYSDPSTMSRHVTRIHKKHAPSNPKRTMKERTESLLPTTLAPLAVHSGSDPTVTNCVDYNLSWHMTGELSKEERGSLSVGEHPTTFAPQIHGGFGALNPTVAWDKNFVDHYPDPATAASLCWHPTREHEELPKPKSKTKTELQQLTKAPKPTVKIAEPSPQWNVDLVHFMDSCMPVNVASWHSDTNQIINAPYPLYTHQTSCAAPVPDLNSYGQTSQCCRLDFHPEFPSLGGRSDGVGNYFESLSIF